MQIWLQNKKELSESGFDKKIKTTTQYNKPSTHYKKKTLILTLIALPGLIFFFIFNYMPIFGLALAFKDYRYDLGFWGSKWVGFKNFSFFFKSQDAWKITRNTLGYNIIFIITVLIGAVFFAIILNEIRSKKAVKFYQTVMFFPYFMSYAVVAFVVYALLNSDYGVLNRLLHYMGIDKIQWYSEKSYWTIILPMVNFWKQLGYNVIIIYAALISIDTSYNEAAAIDGASKFQIITKVTIPQLMSIIIMLGLIMMGRIFYSDFGLFYMVPMDSGIIYPATDVIDTYVYRSLRVVGDIGMSTAIGLYQSLVGLVLVLFTNWLTKKYSSESALF